MNTPYVSEDTRVRFTEQISGHCDPGLYWGHLNYPSDGWTQPKHKHSRAFVCWRTSGRSVWIFTHLKLGDAAVVLLDVKEMERVGQQVLLRLPLSRLISMMELRVGT